MIYCEAVSNPLLEIADIKALAQLAKKYGIPLVVDNTFSPLSISAAQLGADIVIHSLTKFINGSSDTMGGVVCGTQEFIDALPDGLDTKQKFEVLMKQKEMGLFKKPDVPATDKDKATNNERSSINDLSPFQKLVTGFNKG